MLSTRYFAVMPSASGYATAFFSVRPSVLQGGGTAPRDIAPLPTSSGNLAWTFVAVLAVLTVGGTALWSRARNLSGLSYFRQLLVSIAKRENNYAPVNLADHQALINPAPPRYDESSGWLSCDESGFSPPGDVSDAPWLEAVQALGGSVKAKLGDVTGRLLLSVSTRAGSTRRPEDDLASLYSSEGDDGAGPDSDGEGEGRPLLGAAPRRARPSMCSPTRPPRSSASPTGSPPMRRSPIDDGDDDDQDAVAALMKLRPAMGDSIGDGDDCDVSESPLIDSERMSLLSR